MKTMLLFLFIFITIGCKNNYEKSIEFNEKADTQNSDSIVKIKMKEIEDTNYNIAKDRIVKLYKELLTFKNNRDFHVYGFAISYKYNRWLKEVEEIRKYEKIMDRLYDEGYPVIDLIELGFSYRANAGKETKFSRYFKKKYSKI